MSEIALYRKYRPSKFKDVVGQPTVVEALEASLKNKTFAHAYLFAGSRGTGKTTVARILASELGTSVNDTYEIDAASNRGIDEIRELRDAVRTLPFDSKYKVYIIDEVHMLTTPAFNALLKTLEEPPEHVIFVLATTELHKLPDTIISRCQTFTFRKPSNHEVVKQITQIAKEEGIKVEKDAGNLIALLAEGSFRDAIGILQKVVSASRDKTLDRSEVERVTGAPPAEVVQSFVSSLVARDLPSALAQISKVVENEIDIKSFLKLSMRLLRFIMLARIGSNQGGLARFSKDFEKIAKTELGEEELAFVQDLAKKTSGSLAQILTALIGAYADTDRAYIKQLPLELELVKVFGNHKES